MAPAADITLFQGPVGSLRHRCPMCPAGSSAKPGLLRCGGCEAFRYCSREHQIAHRPEHKFPCKKIKNARAKVDREEQKVRNATEDFMTPANAFETHVGHFWGILNTRDYMRARFLLAQLLLLTATLDGIEQGLEHLRDMLRLCRSDNLGVRDMVPATMLRLDLDQEAYDFVKWWATCDPDGRYDWGDMTLPYLNIRGADVFEDPDLCLGKHPALNFLVALLILKLKLVVDIRNVKISRKVFAQRPLPLELRDQIEQNLVRSPLSAKLYKESYASLLKTEMVLLDHICEIGTAIAKTNSHFMYTLFDPEEALRDNPGAYSLGSWEEMSLAMQNSYTAWWETEGVLDLLNDTRVCAARDSESEIEDRMENARWRQGRTAAELLFDVSVNRIWGYLDYAAENASYLGPWSERPSERYTREDQEAWDRAVAEEAEEAEYKDGAWSDDNED
ncbi:hypothetical protein GGR50DRAFT_692530 [Xylaria sp. CBS 124048]|nr:hypothetical protein GGR50DRAFT_692530 [Xylaria sp. CBS 124048]